MSFDALKSKLGRKPLTICKPSLSSCSLSFGSGNCNTIFGNPDCDVPLDCGLCYATGEPCYNTRSTCKDVANFTATTVTHTFIDEHANVPIGEAMFPSLVKVSSSANRVTFGKGLGYRAKGYMTLRDFIHDDVGIDPYVSSRTYDTEQGTFLAKMIARDKYFVGRSIEILEGYEGDTFDLNNFESREYIIENFEGPDDKGMVKVSFVDMLKKIDNKRSQCPIPSNGVLLADITDIATSLTLTPTGIGDTEYDASGLVRCGSEIMDYTRVGDVLTITRGQYGTEAKSHTADDTVQKCKVFDDNCVDILYELLNTYAEIDSSWLPYNNNPSIPDEWDDEKQSWLLDVNHYNIISKPTGVATLVDELTYQSTMLIWADSLTKKIKIRALAPATPTVTVPRFDDDAHIIAGTIKIQRNDDERLTELWVSYLPFDWSNVKDSEDFKQTFISVALEEESDDLYGDLRVKHISSRWFTTQARVSEFSTLMIKYAKNAPITLSLSVDAEHKIEIGDYVDIKTRLIQDVSGIPIYKRYYVTESKQSQQGHKFDLKVRTSFFDDLSFAYFAPDDAVDYTTDSIEYKNNYWYFTDDNGLNPDSTEGDIFI